MSQLEEQQDRFRDQVRFLKEDCDKRERKLMCEARVARDINYWVLQGQIKELGRTISELEELLKEND